MKRDQTRVIVVALLALSVAIYAVEFALFRDARNMAFYTLLDLAFIPIEVIVVGLVINRLLAERERRGRLHKLNMVIGAFESEVGSHLLRLLSAFDTNAEQIRPQLRFEQGWKPAQWDAATAAVRDFPYAVDAGRGDLAALRAFLLGKRAFLLRLLENPNLLEHETFTELLWAVFHLTEELEARADLANLSRPDREHLAGDIRRAYTGLLGEWLGYMRHLQSDYPYLFSLEVRTNPFDPDATVEFA